MPYLVTVPLVLVRVPDQVGDGYRVDYYYEGSVIPELYGDQAERFVDEKLVEKVGGRKASKAKADKGSDDQLGGGDPDAELVPPPHAALKEAWVDFVVAKTATTDKPVTAEEADALSKPELIELYGG